MMIDSSGICSRRLVDLPAIWVVRAITMIVLLALWPSVTTLVQTWVRILDYRSGFFVVAACFGWLFVQSKKLNGSMARPNSWALPALLLATILWAAAYLAASDMVHQILLPVVLWLAIVASAGNGAARLSVEPIACLYLAMPLWDYLLPFLQSATVFVTEWTLRTMGIPTQVLTSTVRIPEGSFEIAEGCSGKKYFLVAVTLSIFAGAYCRLSVRNRAIFTVTAAALALAANWLRVIVVVVAGHLTNMQHYLVAREHQTFGSVLFFLLIVALGLVLRMLSPKTTAPIPPQIARPRNWKADRARLAQVALAVLPLSIPLATSFTKFPVTAVKLAALPVLAGEWQGPLPPDANWQPRFHGAADEARASYRSPSGTVEVYLNVYGSQEDGRELVNYSNSLLAPQSWQVESAAVLTARPIRGSETLSLNMQRVKSRADRWIVSYLYETGGHTLRSDLGVQLGYGALRLVGRPASGVIAVAAHCSDDCGEALSAIENFLKEQGDSLVRLLPKTYPDT